jgi:phytoene synthase
MNSPSDSPESAIRQGSKSFALASLFLPKKNRWNAYLLYQWCRTCDDLIDEAPTPEDALRSLQKINTPSMDQPSLKAPSWVNSRDREEFIAGFRMDVEGFRYRTFHDLELYCFRVAGVVGLMMCPVLGAAPDHASPFAATLGMAMQLTNIARDVQADALGGRVYLPESLIGQVSAETLARTPEVIEPAVREILQIADGWYSKGFQGVAWLPLRTSFAIALAGVVYQKIGHKLLKNAKINSPSAFRRRTVVSSFEKLLACIPALWIVLKYKILQRSPVFIKPGPQGLSCCPALLLAKTGSSPAHVPL